MTLRRRFRDMFRRKPRGKEVSVKKQFADRGSEVKVTKLAKKSRARMGSGRIVTGQRRRGPKGRAPTLTTDDRVKIYTRQRDGGRLTPAQTRRIRHKEHNDG